MERRMQRSPFSMHPWTDKISERHLQYAAYGSLLASFSLGLLFELRRTKLRARSPVGKPRRTVPWQDVLLIGIATHKMARILATDRVTQPLRAPFTQPQKGQLQPAEGGALRRSVGELITCPYCLAPWLALGMGTAYLYRPELTRQVARLFTSVSVSDFLNRAYARLADDTRESSGNRRRTPMAPAASVKSLA